MERLCLALCHPPLIKKSRLWPTHRSVSLFSSFYNDRRVFFTQTVIICCRYGHGNLIPVLFCLQGGLRNSKHEFTLSSQEYVHELRSGITEEKLFHCLESLRVSLTSNPVRYVVPASFTLHKLLPVCGEFKTHSQRVKQKSPSECWGECLDSS